MRRKYLLLAILGLLETAAADPKDPSLTDETLLREHFQRSQAQARETLRKRDAKQQEFLDRAGIGQAGDSCLAYAIESGDCSISAAQFDRYLPSYFPDSLESRSEEAIALSAARARRAVFDQLLDRAFLNAYQPDSMGPTDPRSQRIPNESRGLMDAAHLLILLQALPQIRAQVFAASDSGWLAARMDGSHSDILPVTLPAYQLPDTVISYLANSLYGEWSPILRVPFGYLTCIWLDPLPSSGLLRKVVPLFPWIESEARVESRSEALLALRNHKESCLEEDTLGLVLRLAPARRRNATDFGPGWAQSSSAGLPAHIKNSVWTKLAKGKSDTLGPVRSDYGLWTLTRQGAEIKPGKLLDSAACMAKIEARLRIQDMAKLLRSEWERMASKMGDIQKSDVRTALLERLAKQGPQPESSYYKMREQWASRSLRFTQDIESLSGVHPSANKGIQLTE
jgi:hypothetical protein